MRSKSSGFSLVELSIVLVILGLLIGGVLAGKSLVRASEVRSVTSEYNRYRTAIGAFKDKYFALPGDITNATSFWGASAACPGTAGTGTQTCDGDGDGWVPATAGASRYAEMFTFWQHLVNAGMIEGNYTGMSTAVFWIPVASNSPQSKLPSALWSVGNFNGLIHSGITYDGRYNFNYLLLTGANLAGNVLTSVDAWNIDTKIDDGWPGKGVMMAGYPGTSASTYPCVTQNLAFASTSTYDLSTAPDAKSCGLLIQLK